MFNGKTVTAIIVVGLTVISVGFGQSLEDNWTDFLHYIVIGKPDLAKGYGQVILQSNPDPVQLFALSQENQEGYRFLQAVVAPDSELVRLNHELVDVSRKVLSTIDQGRFMRRSDPKIIVEEIRRLMEGTERGRLTAVKRLRDAGEYAIPYVLDALADRSLEQDELAHIVWGLPQIGRPAIRPLAAALQTENAPVKAEIIKALGKIGYPQSLAYLQYVVEKEDSPELRNLAGASIMQIDRTAARIPAAVLFFRLAEQYYYEAQSLAPAEDAGFGNVWFWDSAAGRLTREEVDKNYFCELMAMRTCEWALKADAAFGNAIGLWLAAFLKAETAGAEKMPAYFGDKHADALVYATTAGPEYLHQALARAIKDKNADVALGAVEALATTAGEKSLFYALGPAQPLLQALSFDDRAVRYSAAIAVAAAGPRQGFAESKLVIVSLADALGQNAELISETPRWNQQLANSYALRAAEAMLKLAETRNPVIDLSVAQSTLVSATQDELREIQVLAGQILARLASPDAQRAIAAMALNADNDLDVRILAFESLATSAKINAYMLTEQIVDAIYVLISSDETEPDLRAAAAAAYGALNLPSRKVKDLILDQAKS